MRNSTVTTRGVPEPPIGRRLDRARSQRKAELAGTRSRESIFEDPVTYLAELGITASLESVTRLESAA